MLSKEDQSSLLDLAWHWESAYTICVSERGCVAGRPCRGPFCRTDRRHGGGAAPESPPGLLLAPG